jgi:hypothetical protein
LLTNEVVDSVVRRVAEGAPDDQEQIQVARLAGMLEPTAELGLVATS